MISAMMPLYRDRMRLERFGRSAALRIGTSVRVGVVKAWQENLNHKLIIRKHFVKLSDLVTESMITGHLMGRYRTGIVAARYLKSVRKSLGPYDSAQMYFKNKLKLTDSELRQLRSQYGTAAVDAVKDMGGLVENNATIAIREITEQGMHVKEGIMHLREAMVKSGIDAAKPWLLENIVRTQTSIAYMSGRWNANQDEAVQEILWGYNYVTVGDDRVRPSHEALDGISLPKDSPQWMEIWPPNGYACRCDILEIFRGEKHRIKEPPAEGVPDVGWNVNHGVIYNDKIAA